MWTKTDEPSIRGAAIGRIEPIDVLYYYDAPLLFTAKAGIFDVLYYKMDEHDTSDFFLVVPITPTVVEHLKTLSVSILCALRSNDYWIIEAGPDGVGIKGWRVKRSDISPEFLPKPGIGIAPSRHPLPDTIEQMNAFLSVKFSGEQLTDDGMSFKTFKSLVDKFHSAATRLLVPIGLGNLSSSDIFDFPISQPQLSSLILSLQEPRVDAALLEERRIRYNIQNFDIYEQANYRREVFFDTATEFLDEVQRGDLSDQLASDNFSYLETFAELVPSTDSDVEQTEFDATTGAVRHHISINTEQGNRIRKAYSLAATRPVAMRGKIELINGAKRTFVILDDVSQKQVTCALDWEIFDELDRQRLVFNGSRVSVYGDLTRRPRRNYLNVAGRPVFEQN